MKDILELREFFKRVTDEDLVLCTIVKKSGSSYRNVFAKKIVSLNSTDSCGLLSGGCLEKEIDETARENFDKLPLIRTFSTLNEEDRLLGYQKGCAGVIDILFEKLPRDLNQINLFLPYGTNPLAKGVCIDLKKIGARHFVTNESSYNDHSDVLFEPWVSPVELTIVGCGADADPYLELSKTLGWSIRFVDYRSDLTEEGRFNGEIKPDLIPLDQIPFSLKEGPKTAVVLMTHSYEADLNIYAGLLEKEFGYLGCVGPRRRYELLKQDLKNLFDKQPSVGWEEKTVKAPPGITSADHTPAEIAFSIVADIQLKLGSISNG